MTMMTMTMTMTMMMTMTMTMQIPVFGALIICPRQRLSMDTGDFDRLSDKIIIVKMYQPSAGQAGHYHHHHRGQAAECRPSRFRKIDGSCNSLVNSNYGRTGDDHYDYDDIDDHD